MESMYVLLLCVMLAVVSGSPTHDHDHGHSHRNDTEKPHPLIAHIQAMKGKTFQRIDDKFVEMTNELEDTLGTILEIVQSIERGQKFFTFCLKGKCGEHGTCGLAESEDTYHCTCNEGYGGQHCELTAVCAIDLYNDQQKEPMLGRPIPKCDDEGLYAPVQSIGTTAYCVTPENKEIGEYNAFIWESNDMTCKCARDEESTGDKLFCTPAGDYSPVACNNTVCWCQDAEGVHGETVPIGELETHLSC